MAFNSLKHAFFFLLIVLSTSHIANAGDPDIISDFILPEGVISVDGSFFTYTPFAKSLNAYEPDTFQVIKATMAQFPALNGQSVSYAILLFPIGTVNPPHTHPRSAELLFLLRGTLEVGFVDTTNKLYTQTLQAGDMFVFPKGLVHYQYSSDAKESSVAVSAFGSASAGTVSVPLAVFNTSIDNGILAKSFKTDIATIQKIKAGLAP
ncbi:germin-like protein 9-3 [Tasmannia lanceolata]|uniref:germin-like protein 9-3 n=1 Tax=Tasmannia lanceolata TaxID=3420 RepID=UPI004064C47B